MEDSTENLRGCSHQLLPQGAICNPSSCNKMNVYNFLSDIPKHINSTKIVEIRFKNTRKAFFLNVNDLKLEEGDMVAVEASPGHDIGIVSLTGELVLEQMRRKRIPQNKELRKIYRKVKPLDIDKWKDAISREDLVMLKSRRFAKELNLNMKIGDVEFQGDGTKAIFYYIADERVDFRKLIRVLADEFHIRVEMRQIGARQEASRVGGIGSCGRELCCSSWMSDFITVTTDTAREQDVSLNPQKLAGQCGKLKCCLNFEIESYRDAKKEFPSRRPLETEDGTAYFFKKDTLKKMMWYSFAEKEPLNVTAIHIDRVKEIQEMNKNGEKPVKLKNIEEVIVPVIGFENSAGEDSITRFDNLKPKKRRSSRRRKRNSNNQKSTNNRQKTTSNNNKTKYKKSNTNSNQNKNSQKQGGNQNKTNQKQGNDKGKVVNKNKNKTNFRPKKRRSNNQNNPNNVVNKKTNDNNSQPKNKVSGNKNNDNKSK